MCARLPAWTGDQRVVISICRVSRDRVVLSHVCASETRVQNGDINNVGSECRRNHSKVGAQDNAE